MCNKSEIKNIDDKIKSQLSKEELDSFERWINITAINDISILDEYTKLENDIRTGETKIGDEKYEDSMNELRVAVKLIRDYS